MTAQETINLINKKKGTKLSDKGLDVFSSYDAEDDFYIVEIKNRRGYYPTKMIEALKLFTNYHKAQKMGKHFLYIVTDESGLYVFNISKVIDEIIDLGVKKTRQPSTTDFDDDRTIVKYVYFIPETMSICTFDL